MSKVKLILMVMEPYILFTVVKIVLLELYNTTIEPNIIKSKKAK